VALAGDNGAGKSTLIKAISGVFQDDEDDIYLDGKRVAFTTPQEAHKTAGVLPRSRLNTWRARHVESL
jgi:ABC-type sugar transport system ATPase subunit